MCWNYKQKFHLNISSGWVKKKKQGVIKTWDASLTSCEGDPPCVLCGFSTPVWGHQQSTGDREGDDAHDDKEERGDPLRRESWGDAGSISSVNGLTLTHQPHSKSSWNQIQHQWSVSHTQPTKSWRVFCRICSLSEIKAWVFNYGLNRAQGTPGTNKNNTAAEYKVQSLFSTGKHRTCQTPSPWGCACADLLQHTIRQVKSIIKNDI